MADKHSNGSISRNQTVYEMARLYTNMEAFLLRQAVFRGIAPESKLLVAAQEGRREWDKKLDVVKVRHPNWRPEKEPSDDESQQEGEA